MSVAKRRVCGLFVAPMLACLVLGGCNDEGDDDIDVVDGGDAGGPLKDAGGMDGGAAVIGDAQVVVSSLSANGHDRFFGVAYDKEGNVYAVGNVAEGTENGDDTQLAVVKFDPAGAKASNFGDAGVVLFNVVPGGQNVESARGILVQETAPNAGKVVVVGEADHAPAPVGIDGGVIARDTDIVLARFTATGQLDTTFGGGTGYVKLDLGAGVANMLADGGTQLAGADTAWSIGQTSDGKLVVHGATRAAGTLPDGGARIDTDFTLIKLSADGVLDNAFGTGGVVKTDVGTANASARSATVLPDNSIVAAGYTTSTALGTQAQQPVLYKVTPNGTPDNTFAGGGAPDQITTPGVWHGFARSDKKNAEAYGAAAQGNRYVTIGYGPTATSTGTGTDWVFFRFNGDGTQDTSFGTGGQTFLDPGRYSDNGRGIAILPDDRIIGVGGGRPTPMVAPDAGQPTNVDGMIGVLKPDGQADDSFGTGGIRLHDWGDTDFLHAVQVAPGKKQVAIVGAAGGQASGGVGVKDDDAVLLLLPIQ